MFLAYPVYYKTIIKISFERMIMNFEDFQIKSPGAGFSLITTRFSEEGQALRHLFQASLSFQSLCDDYQECLAELHNWKQSTSEEAPAWSDEYAHLLLELKQEVRHYLEQEQSSGSKP